MSFSAEMKDFLSAYKTGQQINASKTDQEYKTAQTDSVTKKTERDNDPETLALAKQQAEATLAGTKQRMSQSAAASGRAGTLLQDRLKTNALNREFQQERLNQLRGGAIPGASGLMPTGPLQSTLSPGGVLPVAPSTIDTGEDEYADGGLVEEPDDEEVAAEEPVLDIAAPAQPMTDVSAQSRQPREPRAPRGLEGVISPQLVHDATRQGMQFGIDTFGLNDPAVLKSPQARQRAMQFAKGVGGLSEQEMAEAKKAVDPQGKLSESQRNMAALGSVYQFWANKGEPQKAQRVAFQMLQYYRNATQRYAAIAARAAEGGNMDLATKAALKAYANVPDGNDLEIMPNPDGGLMYTYTDSKGEIINKGIATPQQLASSAMGLAQGGFDKAILAAAGAREAQQGAVNPKGNSGGAMKPGDRAKEAENIGAEIEKLKASAASKNKDKPVDEEQWSEVGNIAQRIYQQNPKANANEVARAAHAMLIPGDDPEKAPFKITPGEEGKPSTVNFGGKLKVQIDDEQLDSILNSRAARVKTAVDAINTKMEEGDKPTTMSKIGEGAKQVAQGVDKFMDNGGITGAVGTAMSKAASGAVDVLKGIYGRHIPQGVVDAIQDQIDETKQRVGSSVRNATRDVQNRGAIPVDDNDRPL